MKIWFGTTTLRFSEHKNYYLNIRSYLLDLGHELIHDWIQSEVQPIYQNVLYSIDSADICILEGTVQDFSVPHQATYATSKKRPTLVLRLAEESEKNTYFDSSTESSFLSVKFYNFNNYRQILDDFIKNSSKSTEFSRYNIMLGNDHKFYLDWASRKYKKSRSEIIRELIENKLRKDIIYRKINR